MTTERTLHDGRIGPTAARVERAYYVDWLRIIAVLLLIPFHTARIYDIWEDFYVKSTETSAVLSYGIIGWLNYWHMPLFFVLAGAATWFALGARGTRGYIKERCKRLLVPLLFGVLVVVPPQGYLAGLFHSTFSGSFLDYLPFYFTPRHADTDYTGLIFTVGHLWFILFLFLMVLIALPLFSYLRRDAGRRAIAALAALSEKRGAILLWFIPLCLVGYLPSLGGKNFFYYIVLFIYGFLLMADDRFRQSAVRERHVALGLAFISLWCLGGLRVIGYEPADPVSGLGLALLSALCTWCWVVALLGIGERMLNVNHPILRYANEAAYPFYILHQSVIVLIGCYVLQWNVPTAAGYPIVAASTLFVTMAIYDWIVRRNNVTRFLFGMKPLPPSPHAVVQPAGHTV